MSVLENLVLALPAELSADEVRELDTAGRPTEPVSRIAGLVLESETAVTLGGPDTASARLLLYSNVPSPVGDRVRLVGPDTDGLQGKGPVAFAEVCVLHGPKVTAETFYQFVQRHQRLLEQPGFMVRNTRESIWVRVTPEMAGKGLAQASATFLARCHEVYPDVEAIDLAWVVADEKLCARLAELSAQSEGTIRAIKEGVWKDRGFDYNSCELAGHCGSCSDKKTCSSVRQIEARVKLKRRRDAAQAKKAQAATKEEV